MKRTVLILMLCIFYATAFSQTKSTIRGKVTSKESNEALPGATISIKGSNASTIADDKGDFVLKEVEVGKVVLVISFVGYETRETVIHVSENKTNEVEVTLDLKSGPGDEVVVTASKRQEKLVNAPASIQVIHKKDFERLAGTNYLELVSKVQGVEYTRNGVFDVTFNARGFHSAFNNKVLLLIDGRNGMASLSGSLPIMSRASTIKDDIERLEIVVGPQSGLYGPNAHNAVFNTITKDPRKYQGTTVSLSAGNRFQFSGRIRHAEKINNKWAYKMTGEYAVGKEYVFNDSVYAGNQPPGNTPFYGQPIAIPERNVDFDFREFRGEANVYYSITPKTDLIVAGGGSNASWPQVTTGGRNQMQGVIYGFTQARLVSPHFYASIYNTWGSIGSSYAIGNYTRDYWNRTHSSLPPTDPRGRLSPDSAEAYALRYGNRFKEKSQRINAEAQYNYKFEKAGLFLIAGLNYQKERPNGYGINLVDSFEKIRVTQYGAVLQIDKLLPWQLRFMVATRFDHHENFGDFVAPKLALVKSIHEGSFRITWGRAYAMPSILNQYAGINRVLFGNGEGITYIPNPPDPGNPSSVKITEPLKPEEVTTWEIGYKGMIVKKIYVDVNYYNGASKNFLSPARSVAGRAIAVGSIPVTQSNPSQFSTFFNYASVRAYGLDAGLGYSINRFINISLKYSWFGSDITKDDMKNDANKDGYVSLEETSLNAPHHRGVAILNLQNLCRQKLFVTISARWLEQYDFYSGSQISTEAGKGSRGKVYWGLDANGKERYYLKNYDWGPLGGFTTIDCSASYEFNQMVNVGMSVTNLFNHYQREFVGSPSIGRLINFEVRLQVPELKKKG